MPTDGNNDGLAGFLANRGWQVWLLDYRASPFVQNLLATRPGGPLGGSALAECAFFTLDRIVDVDIPAALGKLRPYLGDADLSVLGHCIGGGTVATAIARGHFKSVRNVVLSALGLFYEVPWNGWVKVEDYLIERVLAEDPSCRGIDPKNRDAWPASMLGALGAWPAAWLPPVGKDWADLESYEKMLRLLTFMFGQPYFIEALHPTLRRQAIEPVFGKMHIGLYWHIGQMVRRGFVAEFDQPDVIDRLRLRKAGASRRPRVEGHRERRDVQGQGRDAHLGRRQPALAPRFDGPHVRLAPHAGVGRNGRVLQAGAPRLRPSGDHVGHARRRGGLPGDRAGPAGTARRGAATGERHRAGSVKKNVLPTPTAVSTQILPPCASTMPLAMNRPSPVPPPAEAFPCQYFSKMRRASARSIPGP